VGGGGGGDDSAVDGAVPGPGTAVQLDPIKSTLKAPGTKHLKLYYDGVL